MKRPTPLVGLLLLLVLVIAACGGDDDTGEMPDAAGDHSGMDHMDGDDHGDAEAMVMADDGMTVGLAIEATSSGWLATITTTGFAFSPEGKDGPHVPGEGHAHLYVDGAKLVTMLEPTYLIEDLDPGTHVVSVDLRSNDHAVYMLGETALAAEVEVLNETDATADATIELDIVGGEPTEDLGRVEVDGGALVVLRATADQADAVHVHGYDLIAAVEPGSTAELWFTADQPGIYEVELEEAGTFLFELQVNG